MLKLTIKKGHAICIGDDVRIEFEPEHYKDKIHVKTKIFAPDEVPVKRLEIYENKDEIEKDLNDYFKRVKKNKQKKHLVKGSHFKSDQFKNNTSSPQFGDFQSKSVRLPFVAPADASINIDQESRSNKKQPKIIFKKKRLYSQSPKAGTSQLETETSSS